MLEPGEQCETDRGYKGSAPTHVKCPGVLWADPNTAKIQQWVRSRQETVNERFKNWAILSTPYRHNLLEHQMVFGAIVVLTQLSFAANHLFPVEYSIIKDLKGVWSGLVWSGPVWSVPI